MKNTLLILLVMLAVVLTGCQTNADVSTDGENTSIQVDSSNDEKDTLLKNNEKEVSTGESDETTSSESRFDESDMGMSEIDKENGEPETSGSSDIDSVQSDEVSEKGTEDTEDPEDTEDTEDPEDPEDTEDTEDTEDPEDPEDPGLIVDIYQLSIFAYDEYVMFVKKTMLPDYFVSYEELSEFGTFNGFVCLSDATAQDYSSLIYSFVDESGEEFSMYVNYTPKCSFAESKKNKAEIDSKNINTSDMRTVKVTESKSCKYSYQGILYVYSMHGEIMSITWYCEDIEFVLSGIGGYPKTDKTTMVNSLFNLDTALQVVNNIKLD